MLEEERPTLGLSIPSDIFQVAKLLVLYCHVWATLDYPSRTCSSVTWPPFLASPPHTPFLGAKILLQGSIWVCFLVNSKEAMRLEQIEGRE